MVLDCGVLQTQNRTTSVATCTIHRLGSALHAGINHAHFVRFKPKPIGNQATVVLQEKQEVLNRQASKGESSVHFGFCRRTNSCENIRTQDVDAPGLTGASLPNRLRP